MSRLVCFVLLLSGICVQLAGQDAARNPFDLRFRLPRVATRPVSAVTARGITEANPFDVAPHRAPGVAKALVENVSEPLRPLTWLPKGKNMPRSAIFWALVLMSGFLAFSIAANRNAVGKAWRGFLSDNALTLAQRESSGLVGSTPYFLLYANFLLNAGIFIFLIARFFNPDSYSNLPFFFVCLLLAGFLFLSKHVLLAVLGWLLPVAAEVRRYNFLIIIFNCVLGLFLVPFNFLVAFSGGFEAFLVFWTLGLAAIFYLYRSFRAATIGRKFLLGQQFHFFLYLCTAEIAPVLLLIKVAMLEGN